MPTKETFSLLSPTAFMLRLHTPVRKDLDTLFLEMGIKANLPEKMLQDVRGGTRGGRDQFSWSSVKTDKHRASYLGNSIKAPNGRWAEGRDVFWYAKESTLGFTKGEREEEERRRREEIEGIKREEREMMDEMARNKTGKKHEQTEPTQIPPRLQGRSKSPVSRGHSRHYHSHDRNERHGGWDDDRQHHGG